MQSERDDYSQVKWTAEESVSFYGLQEYQSCVFLICCCFLFSFHRGSMLYRINWVSNNLDFLFLIAGRHQPIRNHNFLKLMQRARYKKDRGCDLSERRWNLYQLFSFFFVCLVFFFHGAVAFRTKILLGKQTRPKKRSSYFLGSFGNTFMKQCATFTDYYTFVRSKLKQLFTGLGLFVLRKSFVQGLDIRNKNSNRIFLSTDLPTVKWHIVHLLSDVLWQEDFKGYLYFCLCS